MGRLETKRRMPCLVLTWYCLLETGRVKGSVMLFCVREATRERLQEWSGGVKIIKTAVKLKGGHMSLRVFRQWQKRCCCRW